MKSTLKTPGLIIILSLISFISCIKKPADPPVPVSLAGKTSGEKGFETDCHKVA